VASLPPTRNKKEPQRFDPLRLLNLEIPRMSTITNAPRAQQDRSDNPQFFICLKNGRWHPVDVPAGEAPLAIWYRGRWCPVFRAESDAEFFAAYPEAKFRLTLHRSRWHSPDCFSFTIVTTRSRNLRQRR
jgi:hypothetical protein